MIRPKHNSVILVCLLLIVGGGWCQPSAVPDNITSPAINKNMIPLTTTTEHKNKVTSLGFPDINFEVSAAFYTQAGIVGENELYSREAYTNSVSQYCDLYKTTILAENKFKVDYKPDLEVLKYAMLNTGGEQGNQLYLLGSNSILYVYSFGKDTILKDGEYNMEYKVSHILEGALETNVELLVVGGGLLIAGIDNLWLFDGSNKPNPFQQVKGFQPIGALVDLGVVKGNEDPGRIEGSKIWICSDRQVTIYEITKNGQQYIASKTQQLPTFNQTIFSINYDIESQYFYIIASRTLYTYKFGSATASSEYSINGICKHITKIKSTLFLGCEYEKMNFVAEYRVEGEKLVLNRYYDDAVVEGIRDVESLGYDKIALIGDEQAIIIGEGINRNVLLDLAKAHTTQNYDYAYSFSLVDFYFLDQFSTPQHSTILAVGESSVSIYVITYEPPQVQCTFKPEVTADTISMLVVFNTTHCPFSVESEYNKSGTYALCSTYYPIRLQFAKQEYEQKTATFIFFVVMFILGVLILLCAGFGVKIRRQANFLIQAMQEKIERVRKQRQNSQLKKL